MCWQTVEQQSNPALAIASAVSGHAEKENLKIKQNNESILCNHKKEKMNYKGCPHYKELVQILSVNKDFENVSFQLNDIQNCEECSKLNEEVCNLWVSLALVDNLRPQMGITEAKLTIENLDAELKKIAFELIKNYATENDDASH